MSGLAAVAADWIAANPGLTWAIAFLVSAAEAVVVVGALVPGTPILMAIGAAASLGHVSLWGVVAAAAAGAAAGDGLSYWIGHSRRDRLLRGWPFSSRPGLLAHSEAFFRRWGALGVAGARFLPGVRAVVPVVAGMLGMRPAVFYAANVASALVWAPVHVLPGALVGMLGTLHLPPGAGELALPAAAAAGALVWAARRIWRRTPKGPAGLDRP